MAGIAGGLPAVPNRARVLPTLSRYRATTANSLPGRRTPSACVVRQTAAVDGYEGPARLEWWANSSTCLAAVEIEIELTATVQGTSWQASAAPAPALDDQEREGWSFLLELSPYATLVIPGASDGGIEVYVEEAGADRLVLTTPADAYRDGRAGGRDGEER